jgi:hypothetical protein
MLPGIHSPLNQTSKNILTVHSVDRHYANYSLCDGTSLSLLTYLLSGFLVFFDAKKRQTTCQIQKLGPKTRKPLNL